jgi:hypothetical protein
VAGAERTFDVHYQAVAPQPSWTAWRRWTRGLLTVHDDHAVFESRSGERLIIRNVTEVSQPSRRELYRRHDISWPVNTWVRVRYSDSSSGTATAFFNDGRFLGHYLSQGDLLATLRGLVRA